MITAERHANARDRFRDALGLFVGSGRRHAIGALAGATGISATQISDYLNGRTTPSVANLGLLFGAVGSDLVNAWLAHFGLCGARPIEGPEQSAQAALSTTAAATATLARALEDGRIDHTELPDVIRDARETAHALLRLCDGYGPRAVEARRA